jgi:hypothetical protein
VEKLFKIPKSSGRQRGNSGSKGFCAGRGVYVQERLNVQSPGLASNSLFWNILQVTPYLTIICEQFVLYA